MFKAYLEPEEVEKLITVARYQRDKIFLMTLFRLGCRVSEALRLEVKDIDFARGNVTIQHLKSSLKINCPKCSARLGRSHTYCPKCGLKVEEAVIREQEHRRVRTLPLNKGTIEMLKDYIDQGGPVKRGDKNLLFGFNRHRGWQIIRECAQRAGLPKLVNPETGRLHGVSPHKLRDAFAVHAVKQDDSGDGLRLLQEHLGHQSFNTTAKYRKVAGNELKDWYDKLWQKEVKPDGA